MVDAKLRNMLHHVRCVVRCTIAVIVATDTDIAAIVVALTDMADMADMADMVAVEMAPVALTDTVATRAIVIENLS